MLEAAVLCLKRISLLWVVAFSDIICQGLIGLDLIQTYHSRYVLIGLELVRMSHCLLEICLVRRHFVVWDYFLNVAQDTLPSGSLRWLGRLYTFTSFVWKAGVSSFVLLSHRLIVTRLRVSIQNQIARVLSLDSLLNVIISALVWVAWQTTGVWPRASFFIVLFQAFCALMLATSLLIEGFLVLFERSVRVGQSTWRSSPIRVQLSHSVLLESFLFLHFVLCMQVADWIIATMVFWVDFLLRILIWIL